MENYPRGDVTRTSLLPFSCYCNLGVSIMLKTCLFTKMSKIV